jgi:hypothetical protein
MEDLLVLGLKNILKNKNIISFRVESNFGVPKMYPNMFSRAIIRTR